MRRSLFILPLFFTLMACSQNKPSFGGDFENIDTSTKLPAGWLKW